MATLQDRFNINSQLEHLQVTLCELHCNLCRADWQLILLSRGTPSYFCQTPWAALHYYGKAAAARDIETPSAFTAQAEKQKIHLACPYLNYLDKHELTAAPEGPGFLQAKYVGTGHADLNRFEWAVNIHRDSYASYVGHHNLLAYFAVAENESIGRVKYQLLQKMLLPCGLPPARDEE